MRAGAMAPALVALVTCGLLLGLGLGCGGGAVARGGDGDGEAPTHAAGHPGAHEHEHEHEHEGGGHQHDFSDADRFAEIFDDPERDAWQKPEEVVRLLELSPGMTVADIGAGTGYFLPHLVAGVAGADGSGRVIGLDVEPNMVGYMRERIEREQLVGAEARQVPPDGPGLAAASVDRILIVDTWHHLADRGDYAAKLAAALEAGGFALVVDFTREAPHGPPPAMRLTAEQVAADLRAGGLEAEVLEESLPYQYVVRARR